MCRLPAPGQRLFAPLTGALLTARKVPGMSAAALHPLLAFLERLALMVEGVGECIAGRREWNRLDEPLYASALRRVERLGSAADAWRVGFFSADWTPWPVVARCRARWPALGFRLRVV